MAEPLTVLTVVGTRPEAIKLAPVVQALGVDLCRYRSRLCVTAQHRDMLDQVLALFQLVPDHDLDLMTHEQDLLDVAAGALRGLRRVLQEEAPDFVLVQGDTTTTLAASLAASYCRVPVGHVEAGLRTHDRDHPFPEEINRRLTSHLATLHFAPTTRARDNLLREGIAGSDVFVTGNTVIDALLAVVGERVAPDAGRRAVEELRRYGVPLDGRRLVVVTGHRRESFGQGMLDICEALRAIAQRHPDVTVVYAVHRNPNVERPVRRHLADLDNVTLTPPLDYATFAFLMSRAWLILTDSGGIQEEAPSLDKPVLVMRDVTERPEAVDAGTATLVGTDPGRIREEASRLLEDERAYARIARRANPYGDGHATERILRAIDAQLGR